MASWSMGENYMGQNIGKCLKNRKQPVSLGCDFAGMEGVRERDVRVGMWVTVGRKGLSPKC